MIVLLFSVMAGLAALARGVLFTVAVSLALVVSVSVLFFSLQLGRAIGAPTWISGALAILAFVLVVGGPAYLLAIRGDSAPGTATPDDQGTGDDPDRDTPAGDSDERDADVGGSDDRGSSDRPASDEPSDVRDADGDGGQSGDGRGEVGDGAGEGAEEGDGDQGGDGTSLGTPGG